MVDQDAGGVQIGVDCSGVVKMDDSELNGWVENRGTGIGRVVVGISPLCRSFMSILDSKRPTVAESLSNWDANRSIAAVSSTETAGVVVTMDSALVRTEEPSIIMRSE